MNGLVVFPTFFNLPLNLAIKSSWSEPQSVPSLVFADCVELLHFWLQRIYNQSDFNIDHLVMSKSHLLCFWKRVFAMTSVFSWQNSVSLCPASFCTPRLNLSVTPGISWLPTFAFHFTIMKGTSFMGVSSRRSYIEQFNFSFFSITVWGIDLDYSDFEWFALEMNRDYCVISETSPKNCISDSFVDYEGYSISSKGFLPTVVNIMVIWVRFSHSPPLLVCWILKCRCSLLPSPVQVCLDWWT